MIFFKNKNKLKRGLRFKKDALNFGEKNFTFLALKYNVQGDSAKCAQIKTHLSDL